MTDSKRIWISGKQCRTFGDLLTQHVYFSDYSAACRFCNAMGCEKSLAKYGVRHYVCEDCAVKRADTVLPGVLAGERREAFWAKVRSAA
jgi:hypothetical protein